MNIPAIKPSNHPEKPVVWSIAASDSGGGAGIQADIKTLHSLGVHACTLVTAITAQNTLKLDEVYPLSKNQIQAQLTSLNDDLYPAAVKIGVPPTPDALPPILDWLRNFNGFSVWDPVLKASTGGQLSSIATADALIPLVSLITPNCQEASILTQIKIASSADMLQAAHKLLELGAQAVLLKGGHGPNNDLCQDLYLDKNQRFWMTSPRQKSIHSHGTGCTLASAIAAFKAQGQDTKESLVLAHAYVQQGLRTSRPQGHGEGPVNQGSWPKNFTDYPIVSDNPDLVSLTFPPSPRLGVYAIVDNLDWLQQLLVAGVKTLQLRIKSTNQDHLKQLIAQAVLLGNEYNAQVFINDHWRLAIEAGAYGVHLGQEDLEAADLQAIQNAGLQLGISTHNLYEICRAHQYRPSYIAIGPIFNTQTKVVKAKPVGLQPLSKWNQLLNPHYTLTCIGGITPDNSQSVQCTHISSIAVVSALSPDEEQQNNLSQFTRQFPY